MPSVRRAMFIESAATRTCPPPGGHVDIQSSDSVLKEDMDLLAEVRISRRIRLINMASMKWLFKSSTNDDTLIISRHKSVIMDSTVKFAPNIRPPVFSFGFLRSIVASWRDQSSIRAPGLMKIDSHSSDWRRSSHYEGTSSCERRAP